MSAWMASLTSLVISLLAGLVARLMEPREGRWVLVAGLAAALFGAVLLALGPTQTQIALWGPLHLQVDSITATMMMPICLAALSLVVSAERRVLSPHALFTAAVITFTAGASLLASERLPLLLAELTSAAAAASLLWSARRRAGALYLSLSAALTLAALAWSASLGQLWEPLGNANGPLAALLLLAALFRLGIFPFVTGLSASMGRGAAFPSLLAAAPLGGVPLLLREVQPALVRGELHASWLLTALLIVGALAAIMAIAQRRAGRALAFIFSAQLSLIVVGALDTGEVGHVGGEVLWGASLLALTGFGISLSLVQSRLGDPDLALNHGLHRDAPRLSALFLVLGLSSAGIPGTLDFVATDILLQGATVGTPGLFLVVAILSATAFAVLRLYFSLFFGHTPQPRPWFELRVYERAVLLLVVAALLIGGVAPGLVPLLHAH